MKNFLLLSVIFTLIASECYATTHYGKKSYTIPRRTKPYVAKIAPRQITNTTELSQMEQQLFQKNYNKENINSRLDRLEKKMYGTTKPGTIADRYKNLNNAFNYNYPDSYYNKKYYPQYYKHKISLWDKFNNYFFGNATGITPNADGFYYENYSSGPFGRGYYNSVKDYGTGASIKILD